MCIRDSHTPMSKHTAETLQIPIVRNIKQTLQTTAELTCCALIRKMPETKPIKVLQILLNLQQNTNINRFLTNYLDIQYLPMT